MAQLHFLAVYDTESKAWHAEGMDEAPVDNQTVWVEEDDEWRVPTDEEREQSVDLFADLVHLLDAPDRAAVALDVVNAMYWSCIDHGPSLTCKEANAMAELFRAYGKQAQGDAILMSHAGGDDEPTDEHHGMAVDGVFSDTGFKPGPLPGAKPNLTVVE